jgi:multimeric flavodoxin WrbA
MADTEQNWDFTGLRAMFLNGTLKRSPEVSNTEGLIEVSASIMRRHGVEVEVLRAIDHDIATGVYPDMTEHGWETDEWPQIWERVKAANILVIAGPIWLGDNSSKTKQIIERLYAQSGQLNDQGQYAFYGRVGGALITGNEDGVKHCTMNILYSLQHLGYVVPPQADAGWIGDIGPGPSYLDEGSGGPENDFTNRNTTFMTWNLMHLAAMIQAAGGIPAYGNQRSAWDEGERFDFVQPNPEYR